MCKGIIKSPLATLIHDNVLANGLVVKTGSDYVEALVTEARQSNANTSATAQALNNEVKQEVENQVTKAITFNEYERLVLKQNISKHLS